MKNIKLTRVDFRLIHGQVMTRWVVNLGITKIVVIDDNSAHNPILSRILVNAVPNGTVVNVYDQDSAIKKME